MPTASPRLLATFLVELDERLGAFEQDLLALESVGTDPERREITTSLFRGAHSLKGAAGAVGLQDISDIAHRAEDLLARCRDRPGELDRSTIDVLLGVVDALRSRAEDLRKPAEPKHAEAPALPHREGTLRVDAEKLDALLQHTGELVVALTTGADRAYVERSARRVDAEVRSIRMLPFALACEGLERTIRDAAAASGKKCKLQVVGGSIELDRTILDGLRDPLLHLVRNAIGHGIETPERRAAVQKPIEGTIIVNAALRGGGVEVDVSDDGAGLDLAAIRARAEQRGYAVNDLDVGGAVFLPGVSTASDVTRLSGRGIGLDAVRSSIEAMRGSITVRSESGKGTRFTLLLPLTLTTLRAVLFVAGGRTFALESAAIERIVRSEPESIVPVEGRLRIMRDGSATALVDCADLLSLRQGNSSADSMRYAIFIKDTLGRVALAVDELLDEREVVVRPLGARLAGVRSALGATILPDGSVATILRGGYIVAQAHARARRVDVSARETAVEARRHILLVEDSMTTRTLERSILEAAGYDVTTAGDGEEGWTLLQDRRIDLVVADVDMPRLDGFGLTERIRGAQHLSDLPVVLVTARGSEADKRRGVDAGADAYITKSGFDQGVLLRTIAELL